MTEPGSEMQMLYAHILTPMGSTTKGLEGRALVRTSERQRAKWQAAACVAGER